MPQPANYFRIGLFIILAIAVLLVGLVVFGAGQFFRKKIIFETYEKGTIQGVDIGSPVKFRGVQVGQVTWIGFALNAYPEEQASNRDNYVIIRMQIDKEIFPDMFTADLGPILEKGINNGLRVRIEPQGITGMNYIEMNFLDEGQHFPLLSFNWKPDYYYIPSAPGELKNILDSVNKMMRDLENLNLAELQSGLNDLLKNLNKAVTGAEIDKLSTNLQTLLTQLDQTIASADLGGLSSDARGLMTNLDKSNQDLRRILQNLEPATRIDPKEVRDVVKNLSEATANMEQFTQSIKQRPSLLLWGSPPKPKPTPTPRPRR